MTIRKKAGRISPVLMGDYDNTTVYRRLDWVKYGGTSYICKKNNTTGIVPSDPDRWQKIIDEANLNIPNHWQMTSRNGKGTIEQIGTTWIMTVPTMSEASDAATAYWGVKLAKETEYTIRYGMSNGADGDSMYVNVSDTQGSHYQFSRLENGDSIRFVKLPKDAWVWMKFQHYSNNIDNAYAYLILEPITMLEERRISFSAEHTRENISSTDTLYTIFGKIKKYFSDLKTVAFTGSYTDLSDKPVSLKNPKSLKFTGGVTAEYDGSTEKSIAIPTSLKNPNTLNIKFNGTSQTSYDGSATKEVNITPAGISAVNTSTVLTTKEQISANTNANNVTGALVTKALMSDINTINSNIQSANDELSQKSTSIINSINYMSDLKRTYQLKPNKAYLVTVFAYSFDNADAIMNTGAFFVYTPYSNGANGAIREIYDSGHVTLSVDSNCLLSIEGTYRYMHYSITQL